MDWLLESVTLLDQFEPCREQPALDRVLKGGSCWTGIGTHFRTLDFGPSGGIWAWCGQLQLFVFGGKGGGRAYLGLNSTDFGLILIALRRLVVCLMYMIDEVGVHD